MTDQEYERASKKIEDVLSTPERVELRRRIDPDDAEAWDIALGEHYGSVEEGYFEFRFGKGDDDFFTEDDD